MILHNTKESVKDELLETARKLIYVEEKVGEWNLTSYTGYLAVTQVYKDEGGRITL